MKEPTQTVACTSVKYKSNSLELEITCNVIDYGKLILLLASTACTQTRYTLLSRDIVHYLNNLEQAVLGIVDTVRECLLL